MSIKARLFLVAVLALFGLLALSTVALVTERSDLLEDRKTKTRQLVEVAHSVLEHYYQLQRRGELSEAEAKAAAVATIKSLRYDSKEYFWINDLTSPVPRMIMHATVPALDGTILDAAKFNCATSEQEGLDGPLTRTDGRKNLFVAFNDVVGRAGHGFVTYDWPKPKEGGGTTEALYPKLSYVTGFAGWNWVVGSGIYIDDLQAIFWQRATLMGAITLGLAVLIGVLLLYVIRGITVPLAGLRDTMKAVQDNQDLTGRVPTGSRDEVGAIGQSFNDMLASFREVIRHVFAVVGDVTASANRLSGDARVIADNLGRQSEDTAGMAAAVQQLSVSIDHVKENADDTRRIAHDSGERSRESARIIQHAVDEMNRIAQAVTETAGAIRELEGQAGHISDIVSVIREIADQTNLLALNAAIEAARAGEQGRGFAVVADEVRKLAERTSEATVQISQMIDTIQHETKNAAESMETGVARVQAGVELASRAGSEVAQMQDAGRRIIDAVDEIGAALTEQATAAREIAGRVEHVSAGTEQMAASSHETSGAAEQLRQMAENLQALASRFRV